MATASAPLTPTAPLPTAAVTAMSRLERAFLPLPLVRAVTRHEIASRRTAELSALMDSRDLSPAEFGSLELAQDTMRQARSTLVEAGRADLLQAVSA